MDQKVKAQWLAALRSGDYKQGTGQLRKGDSFCCLGVLCDLSGLGQWVQELNGEDRYEINGKRKSGLPQMEVAYWAGLERGNPRILELAKAEDEDPSLSNLNDDGLTFSQIADLIEHFL